MTQESSPDETESDETTTDEITVGPPAAKVRRRRPEQTRDDTDRGWGERSDEDEHERWLREQRPPHWG